MWSLLNDSKQTHMKKKKKKTFQREWELRVEIMTLTSVDGGASDSVRPNTGEKCGGIYCAFQNTDIRDKQRHQCVLFPHNKSLVKIHCAESIVQCLWQSQDSECGKIHSFTSGQRTVLLKSWQQTWGEIELPSIWWSSYSNSKKSGTMYK